MTKKYFVKSLMGEATEVTHDEYIRMANQQFMGTDIERILESATQRNGVCGTTHMFWTETTEEQ
jgi:hypothetical protein